MAVIPSRTVPSGLRGAALPFTSYCSVRVSGSRVLKSPIDNVKSLLFLLVHLQMRKNNRPSRVNRGKIVSKYLYFSEEGVDMDRSVRPPPRKSE